MDLGFNKQKRKYQSRPQKETARDGSSITNPRWVSTHWTRWLDTIPARAPVDVAGSCVFRHPSLCLYKFLHRLLQYNKSKVVKEAVFARAHIRAFQAKRWSGDLQLTTQ